MKNIIIAVLVILVAVAGYFMFVKKSGPVAYQTPTPTASPNATKTATPTPIVYTNSRFGFQFTLSEAWKGYKVFSSEGSQGVGAPTYLAFAIPTSDKTKCVMNITDEVCGYVAPLTVTIIAKDRDVSTMDGKLGEDKTNAYYYSIYTHFNELPPDLSKINFEIPKVISTFKFTK